MCWIWSLGAHRFQIDGHRLTFDLITSFLPLTRMSVFFLINIAFGEQLLSEWACDYSRNRTSAFSSWELKSPPCFWYTQGLCWTHWTPGPATLGPVRSNFRWHLQGVGYWEEKGSKAWILNSGKASWGEWIGFSLERGLCLLASKVADEKQQWISFLCRGCVFFLLVFRSVS